MIKALLGKIENAFKPDFLFASFLPTLLFVISIVVLTGEVFGYEAAVAYLGSWSSNSVGLSFAAFSAVGVVILAYIFYGLRSWFLKLWSGQIEGPFGWLCYPGQWFFTERFNELRFECDQSVKWGDRLEDFRKAVEQKWNPQGTVDRREMQEKEFQELLNLVKNLRENSSTDTFRHTTDRVISAYDRFHGDGRLKEIYKGINAKLVDWKTIEERRKAKQLADLDRRFGGLTTIRPTALGNVIEAYNSYPYKRYKIEGEHFWSHLDSLLPEELQKRISDVRVLLDFFLTMATLGVLVAVFSLIVGPWLKFTPVYWACIATIAILISYNVYYKMAVFLAIQYGDLIRASFDLYRLKLLKQLSIAFPDGLQKELLSWQKLNQLVVYSNPVDFNYSKQDMNDASS